MCQTLVTSPRRLFSSSERNHRVVSYTLHSGRSRSLHFWCPRIWSTQESWIVSGNQCKPCCRRPSIYMLRPAQKCRRSYSLRHIFRISKGLPPVLCSILTHCPHVPRFESYFSSKRHMERSATKEMQPRLIEAPRKGWDLWRSLNRLQDTTVFGCGTLHIMRFLRSNSQITVVFSCI